MKLNEIHHTHTKKRGGKRDREKKSKTQIRWAMHAWNMKLMILYNYIAINWSSIHYFHSSWKLAQMSVGRSVVRSPSHKHCYNEYTYILIIPMCIRNKKASNEIEINPHAEIKCRTRVTHTNSAHTKWHRKVLLERHKYTCKIHRHTHISTHTHTERQRQKP